MVLEPISKNHSTAPRRKRTQTLGVTLGMWLCLLAWPLLAVVESGVREDKLPGVEASPDTGATAGLSADEKRAQYEMRTQRCSERVHRVPNDRHAYKLFQSRFAKVQEPVREGEPPKLLEPVQFAGGMTAIALLYQLSACIHCTSSEGPMIDKPECDKATQALARFARELEAKGDWVDEVSQLLRDAPEILKTVVDTYETAKEVVEKLFGSQSDDTPEPVNPNEPALGLGPPVYPASPAGSGFSAPGSPSGVAASPEGKTERAPQSFLGMKEDKQEKPSQPEAQDNKATPVPGEIFAPAPGSAKPAGTGAPILSDSPRTGPETYKPTDRSPVFLEGQSGGSEINALVSELMRAGESTQGFPSRLPQGTVTQKVTRTTDEMKGINLLMLRVHRTLWRVMSREYADQGTP